MLVLLFFYVLRKETAAGAGAVADFLHCGTALFGGSVQLWIRNRQRLVTSPSLSNGYQSRRYSWQLKHVLHRAELDKMRFSFEMAMIQRSANQICGRIESVAPLCLLWSRFWLPWQMDTSALEILEITLQSKAWDLQQMPFTHFEAIEHCSIEMFWLQYFFLNVFESVQRKSDGHRGTLSVQKEL